MSKRPLIHCLAPLLLLSCVLSGPAQEWARFRGPNGTGVSEAKTIPAVWTERDFNWKLPLPGAGHSSPASWGSNVFCTVGNDKAKEITVYCISGGQGKIVWQKSFPFTPHRKNGFNTFASASPAADEHRVYACWTSPTHSTLLALTHAGEVVWEKDLGPFASQHGGGASPIVYRDTVILGNEQDGEGCLIAVDAATGTNRWQMPRKSQEVAYSTPCVYEPKDGPAQLIFTSHTYGICAIDPANGKTLWESPELFDKRVVSSPVLAGGLIIGSCGSGGGGNYLVAVRPGGADGKAAMAYKIRRSAPYVPTSVCVGDRLFLWSDDGVVSCVQAATGEVKWQERVGGRFFGSPVWVDGRLFCVSTTGEVVVVAASDKYQLLARNVLGEVTHSTPAVAGGRMFIHTTKSLVSVGGRSAPKIEE